MKASEIAADALVRAAQTSRAPRTAAVIVAAGNSTRMGKKVSKQFLEVAGLPVLAHTLLAFEKCRVIREIVVVARACEREAVWKMAYENGIKKLTAVTAGGETRALSVERGFAKIHPKTKYVAIHDGARCLITPGDITKICHAAYRHRAATAATAVTDTVKTANRKGFIEGTLDRSKIFLVQTPQVFHADLYRAALANVDDDSLTDDNQLMEKIGYPVKLMDIGKDNMKITTPDDIPRAEWLLSKREVSK